MRHSTVVGQLLSTGFLQVISTSGDTHLGGEDFDHRVMDYFVKLIKKKYNVDVSGDKRALAKLRREAERAKRALSSSPQVPAHADCTWWSVWLQGCEQQGTIPPWHYAWECHGRAMCPLIQGLLKPQTLTQRVQWPFHDQEQCCTWWVQCTSPT